MILSICMIPHRMCIPTVIFTRPNGMNTNICRIFTTSMTMKVDSVTFRSDGTYLTSGTNMFSLADVLEIDA